MAARRSDREGRHVAAQYGRKVHSMSVVCDGLLVESEDGIGECDQGDACQALELQDDYPAYRAAHGRVIARSQAENTEEYGGEG